MDTIKKEEKNRISIDMMSDLTSSMTTQPKKNPKTKSSFLKINFLLLSQIFYLDFQTLE